MTVAEALAQLALELDDPDLIHSTPDLCRRHLSRAQQWMSLKYQILRVTEPMALAASAPWYHLPSKFPRLWRIVTVRREGLPLWPVPWESLKYMDKAWMATEGTPTMYYRLGLTLLGFYRVPDATETVDVTMVRCSAPLVGPEQTLELPDSYLPQVVTLAAGMITASRERDLQKGMGMITKGLRLRSAS